MGFVRLNIDFQWSLASDERMTNAMPSNWANELAAQRKQIDEKKRIEQETRLADEKLMEREHLAKWRNVRKMLAEFAKELNEAYGQVAISVVNETEYTTSITSSDYPVTLATVTFDQPERKLKVPFRGDQLKLVAVNGVLIWQGESSTREQWNDEQVAKRTIEKAWEAASR